MITVNRAALHSALSAVRPAVPKRQMKPVLLNVRMEALAGKLSIQATDLEVGSHIVIPCEGEEEAFLLPFDKLERMARIASGESLAIELGKTTATIKTQSSKWTLPTEEAKDFPEIPFRDSPPTVVLPGGTLLEAMRRAGRASGDAVSENGRRLQDDAIVFDVEDAETNLVGTDAKVMAAFRIVCKHEGPAISILIPPRGAEAIAGILSEEDVSIQVSPNDIIATCGESKVYTRILEGRPVPWRKIIPNGKTTAKINIPAGRFMEAIQRAAIVDSAGDFASRSMAFTFKENYSTCQLDSEGRSGEEEFAVQDFQGAEQTIKIDQTYLLNIIRPAPADELLTLHLYGSNKAIKVTSTMDGWTALAMPQGEKK